MLPAGIIAHPKVDPRTGEMLVFCYLLEAPYLTWATPGRTAWSPAGRPR
jgi:carotenoid cleavage dioxygenase-like enzyme